MNSINRNTFFVVVITLVMSIVFTSCIYDYPNDDVNCVDEKTQTDGFIAVGLRTVKSSDASTKANDPAPADDITIYNANFYFISENKLVGQVIVKENTDINNAYIFNLDEFDKVPDAIYVEVNNKYSDKPGDLEGIKTKTRTLNQVLPSSSNDGFLMSTAVYAKDGKINILTPITIDDIYETEQAAADNPINIKVERVVSKVIFNKGNIWAQYSENHHLVGDNNKIKIDGVEHKISLKLKKWWLANKTNESLVLKKLDLSYKNAAPVATWDIIGSSFNDLENKRSYWATTPAGVQLLNRKYSDVPEGATKQVEYCLENTLQGLKDGDSQHTALVIAGEFEIEGYTGTFYKYIGRYYSYNGIKQILLNQYSNVYYKLSGTETYKSLSSLDAATVDVENFEVASVENKPGYKKIKIKSLGDLVQVLGDGNLYKRNVDNTFSPLEETEYPNYSLEVLEWNKKTYYYIEIPQSNESDYFYNSSDKFLYGIVRNTKYKITANSIIGLGMPVVDGEEIIPQKPEDESYVEFTINVIPYEIDGWELDVDGFDPN